MFFSDFSLKVNVNCIQFVLKLEFFMCRKFVRLGEWNTSSTTDCDAENTCSDPVVEIPVATVKSHEQYNRRDVSKLNDLAIIRLSSKIPKYTSTYWDSSYLKAIRN